MSTTMDIRQNKEFPGYAALVNELLDNFPGEPIFKEQQKDFIRLTEIY